MLRRLVVVFLVPLLAILLLLGGATAWSATRSIQQSFYAEQLGDLGYFAASARQALRSGSATVIDAEVRRFHEVYGVEVIVFDLAGGIWATGGAPDRVRPSLVSSSSSSVMRPVARCHRRAAQGHPVPM